MKNLFLLMGMMISTWLLSACSQPSGSQDSVTKTETGKELEVYSSYDVNKYKLDSLVCDPMGGDSDTSQLDQGVKAKLFYTNGSDYNSVQEYFDKGTEAKFDLFYSHLEVPTRLFTLGFPTETGGMVKDDSGNDLNEYFALKFNTVLKLGEGDPAGLYEFAVLSDDGTIIKYKDADGNLQVLVDNDGDHPTRMGCSTQVLELNHDTELFIELDYYQGPRYHIALVPMWRKIENGERVSEPLCGQKGNSLFFDYNNNSKPQKAYNDLVGRGWRVWGQQNFFIPNKDEDFNPCVEGEAPGVINIELNNDLDGGIQVSWETDIPATAQLRIVNTVTGVESITDSDNVLRTKHLINIRGLTPGQKYTIQVIAISESYGKTISPALEVIP